MGTLLTIVLCMLGFGFCISILHSSWVGRRVGTTPFCAKCGYNLSGRTGEAGPCSECGSDLKVEGAVRIGERQRRWGRFAFGMFLLVGSVLYVSLFTLGVIQNTNLIPYMPTWYLAWQAERANVPVGLDLPAPLSELLRRHEHGELSNSQIDSLVNRILGIQADRTKNWNIGWGDLFEQAWLDGLVSKKQLESYLNQIANDAVSLRVRSKVTHGRPLPIRFESDSARIGTKCHFNLVDSQEELVVRKVGINRNPTEKYVGFIHSAGTSSSTDYALEFSEDELKKMAPGKYELEGTSRFSIIDYDWNSNKSKNQYPRLHSVTIQRVALFEILPANQTTLGITRDPTKKPIAKIDRAVFEGFDKKNPTINGRFDVCSAFVDTAFDVFVRYDGMEFAQGTVDLERRPRMWRSVPFRFVTSTMPGSNSTLDIILRPNPTRAENSVGLMDIWGEPIEILNVPIRR